MHFSMGALGRFHIRIKTWPRLIGSDVSYILFPKASRVTADHKNFRLIDNESTAPIRCMPKNKQLFAFKQKYQTIYKRCSYFSTFRHLPMGNLQACRNVFCKSKKLLQLVRCRPPPPVLCGRFDPGWNRILTCAHTTCNMICAQPHIGKMSPRSLGLLPRDAGAQPSVSATYHKPPSQDWDGVPFTPLKGKGEELEM